MDEPGSELAESLRSRWARRFPDLPVIGAMLVGRYAEAGRVYHDLRHLDDVLRHVDELVSEASDAGAVELAAWFHDAVYDVRRDDNEVASSELARELLAPHLTPERLAEVRRLVLLTRDHAVVDADANGAVLCDADLAVLASTPDEYDDYGARVRAEYSHVPSAAFREGRAAVLQQLLDLPGLFHTAYGRERWESPARANLAAELATLTDGRS